MIMNMIQTVNQTGPFKFTYTVMKTWKAMIWPFYGILPIGMKQHLEVELLKILFVVMVVIHLLIVILVMKVKIWKVLLVETIFYMKPRLLVTLTVTLMLQ